MIANSLVVELDTEDIDQATAYAEAKSVDAGKTYKLANYRTGHIAVAKFLDLPESPEELGIEIIVRDAEKKDHPDLWFVPRKTQTFKNVKYVILVWIYPSNYIQRPVIVGWCHLWELSFKPLRRNKSLTAFQANEPLHNIDVLKVILHKKND